MAKSLADFTSLVGRTSSIDTARGRVAGQQGGLGSLPPGYQVGFPITFDADNLSVQVGVGETAVGGQRVERRRAEFLEAKHFTAGVIVSSQFYYIYVDLDGSLLCDRAVPTVKLGQYGLMHPTKNNFKAIGKLYAYSDQSLVFATANVLPPSREVLIAASTYGGMADYYCDGDADQRELLIASRYLSAAFDGGNELLTPGTFYLDTGAADLQFTQSGLGLIGSGEGVTILSDSGTTGSDAAAVSVVGTVGTHIERFLMQDLTITQTANTAGRNLFVAGYADRIALRRCKFLNAYGSAVKIGVGTKPCLGYLIDNCEAEGFRQRGFSSEGGSTGVMNVLRSHDNIDDAGVSATVYGLFVGDADPVVLINSCTVYTMALGASTAYDLIGIHTGSRGSISNSMVIELEHAHATNEAIGIRAGNDASTVSACTVVDVTDATAAGGVGIHVGVANAHATGCHVEVCGTSFRFPGSTTKHQLTSNVSISPVVAHVSGAVVSDRIFGNSWEFDATTGDWTPVMAIKPAVGVFVSDHWATATAQDQNGIYDHYSGFLLAVNDKKLARGSVLNTSTSRPMVISAISRSGASQITLHGMDINGASTALATIVCANGDATTMVDEVDIAI